MQRKTSHISVNSLHCPVAYVMTKLVLISCSPLTVIRQQRDYIVLSLLCIKNLKNLSLSKSNAYFKTVITFLFFQGLEGFFFLDTWSFRHSQVFPGLFDISACIPLHLCVHGLLTSALKLLPAFDGFPQHNASRATVAIHWISGSV